MKLVVLDRDGVVNVDSAHYIKSPEEWTPIPGSLDVIARLTQAGFRVVYIPFVRGRAVGTYVTFATARPGVTFRPSGVAMGPDGALYIGSDAAGRIWRVVATR